MGWGNRYVEVLVEQVLTGGPWNSAICGKGASTVEHLASERVRVFKFLSVLSWFFGLVVGDPQFRVHQEVKVLSSAHS